MRPVADAVEVRFPAVAALAARLLARSPAAIRRRALADAFDRAAAAFNRRDLAAVFALFAQDVEYLPPLPLYNGPPIHGRDAVMDFWEKALARFDQSQITNLSIEQTAPARFVRTAELHHRGAGEELSYTIRQTTELKQGRVTRQINEVLSA